MHWCCTTKWYQTWGRQPMGFWCNVGIKLVNYKWCAQNLHSLSNSATFSAGWSLLPAYIFLATMASSPLPLALIVWGGCGFPKIFGDWKYASNSSKVAYCQLGCAWRAALMAVLPDNCTHLVAYSVCFNCIALMFNNGLSNCDCVQYEFQTYFHVFHYVL